MESNIWHNFTLVFKHLAELGKAYERWYQKMGKLEHMKKEISGYAVRLIQRGEIQKEGFSEWQPNAIIS